MRGASAMPFYEILLLAIGLAMDCFTVSLCAGMVVRPLRLREAVRIPTFFGGFQALMPVLGWLAGLSLRDYISAYDHWVAFGLLAIVGGKMIVESIKNGRTCSLDVDPSRLPVLLTLAVATSIDALAVGLSFSLLHVSIVAPVLVIGLVSMVLSGGGLFLGRRFGDLLGGRVQIVGGLVLLAIGARIVISHLSAASLG
ncbi:MAG: manganese efflux pump MntP [Anaerolineae bacterium]